VDEFNAIAFSEVAQKQGSSLSEWASYSVLSLVIASGSKNAKKRYFPGRSLSAAANQLSESLGLQVASAVRPYPFS
jgi:hypothetical protein